MRDFQDDLAHVFARLHHGMRGACIFQGQDGVYDGGEPTCFEMRPDLGA